MPDSSADMELCELPQGEQPPASLSEYSTHGRGTNVLPFVAKIYLAE